MQHCPNCGLNFKADEVVISGPWRSDPRGEVTFAGKAVRLSPAERIIFHTIIAAKGRVATNDSLIARAIPLGVRNAGAQLKTNMSKLRAKIRAFLRENGYEDRFEQPIATVRSAGFAWRS